MLPPAVRRWCEAALGAEVRETAPITGGITGAIWRVSTSSGDAILRWLHPAHPYAADAEDWVAREALGCRLVETAPFPSPRLLASDPDGTATGGWANLTTFLPGRVRLDRLGPHAMDALAALAVGVHAVDVSEAPRRPRAFNPWVPAAVAVPGWSRRPALWAEAIERYAAPAPPTRQHLIHRDFHPGNVLWSGDAVTGLIDWAECAWGPSDLDVAHACANFAMLHSVDDALAFRQAYERRGGRLDPDPDAWRYWVCLDALGFLPEPLPIVSELVRRRPDLDADGVRRRLEDLLDEALHS
ncbi:phosphotransferase family protein [Microlunatus flavus]|uniref:Ser/Thr protein kinase RdoA involved in Cpx stress response, MazF antagonist n=1 Tax=Microlunatus flavus TaxID=1036181 RepID=A0A1H9AGQ7_9ACTN|nr:aminoglycoside phosphotransferase family protein [Microlunatus flavus]SEP75839.1 Ser/Thr protein kinase RdoA involved in Cpx stress response, MazF antagonist [Microlunatus flavus]